MSDSNPYEQLGVSESASFEEIQSVRDRLLQAHTDDAKKTAQIEAAYDSVLMQRLKLRQEGKIKVPDGIRFAEKAAPSPSKLVLPNLNNSLKANGLLGLPAVTEIAIPTLVAIALGGLIMIAPRPDVIQFVALTATTASMFGSYRKDKRLFKAVLVGFGGLIAGYLLGVALFSVIPMNLQMLIPGADLLKADVFANLCICFLLWLLALFVK